jgi:hypothetical protein
MIVPLIIAGAGVSMPFATAATASVGAVSPEDVDKASGATNTIQRFGGVFGLAVTTAVFTANGQLSSPAAFVAGFRPAELAAAGLAVLGALSAVHVASKQPTTAKAPLQARPRQRRWRATNSEGSMRIMSNPVTHFEVVGRGDAPLLQSRRSAGKGSLRVQVRDGPAWR